MILIEIMRFSLWNHTTKRTIMKLTIFGKGILAYHHHIYSLCLLDTIINKRIFSFFKRPTNRCRSFDCFCIVNRVNNAPMTRKIPQVNMVHFQMRKFVLIDWLPTDILLKNKSICLWENTASYRRAALSEIIPTATICKKNKIKKI